VAETRVHFVVLLREENEYWQKLIGATLALCERLWQPHISSVDVYRRSCENHCIDFWKMLGQIESNPKS
jgi:hypothetical protein